MAEHSLRGYGVRSHAFGDVVLPRGHAGDCRGHGARLARRRRLLSFASPEGSGHRQDPLSSALSSPGFPRLQPSTSTNYVDPQLDCSSSKSEEEKSSNADPSDTGPSPVATSSNVWARTGRDWLSWQGVISKTYDIAESERQAEEALAASVELQAFRAAASVRDQLTEIRGRDVLGNALLELSKAVAEERYEDASRLRDQTWSALPGWWVGCSTGGGGEARGHLIEIRRRFGHYAAYAYTGADIAMAMGWTPETVTPNTRIMSGEEGPIHQGSLSRNSLGAQSVMEMHFRPRESDGSLEAQAVAILGPAPVVEQGPAGYEESVLDEEALSSDYDGPRHDQETEEDMQEKFVDALEQLFDKQSHTAGLGLHNDDAMDEEAHAAVDEGTSPKGFLALDQGQTKKHDYEEEEEADLLDDIGVLDASTESRPVDLRHDGGMPAAAMLENIDGSSLLNQFHEMARLLEHVRPGGGESTGTKGGFGPSNESTNDRGRQQGAAISPPVPVDSLPRVPADLEWENRDAFAVTVSPRDAESIVEAWRAQHEPTDSDTCQPASLSEASETSTSTAIDNSEAEQLEAALRTSNAMEQVLRAVAQQLDNKNGGGTTPTTNPLDQLAKTQDAQTDAQVHSILRMALTLVKAKRLRDARALRTLRRRDKQMLPPNQDHDDASATGFGEDDTETGQAARGFDPGTLSSDTDLISAEADTGMQTEEKEQDSMMNDNDKDRLRLVRVAHDKADPFMGVFLGQVGPHGPELLQLQRIAREGQTWVQAQKITGDANVPAGELSFEARVDRSARLPLASSWATTAVERGGLPPEFRIRGRYPARGQIAEPGYQNAKWVDAELLEFSPGRTGGAELGVVFSLSQTHRFLVLFNRVDMDGLQQRIDAVSAPQI